MSETEAKNGVVEVFLYDGKCSDLWRGIMAYLV